MTRYRTENAGERLCGLSIPATTSPARKWRVSGSVASLMSSSFIRAAIRPSIGGLKPTG